MQVKLDKLLQETGLEEKFYPGKRVVKPCKQTGQYKSHCVVYDWRDPDSVVISVKAGLSGKTMPNEDLARYPICFQAPTFVEIDIDHDSQSQGADDDDDEGDAKGKSGGGGKGNKPKKKTEAALNNALQAFGDVVEGKIPGIGEIAKLVVMGKEIAKEAFAPVLEALVSQIQNLKISPTELLAKTGEMITKYTPPSFLAPKGDEDKVYKYDQEKNEPMFGGIRPS
jgi:hypothetical protein